MTALETYRRHLVRNLASPATIRAYTTAVHNCARWNGVPIEDLTADHAAAWLSRPGLRPNTREAYWRYLHIYAAWSGALLLEDIRKPPRSDLRPNSATRGQVDAMLEACRCDEDTALLWLLCGTGLRISEAACFTGSQVDPWRRMVRVVGKGGKDAEVPAPDPLLKLARRMPPGYWFPSPTRPGRPIVAGTARARVLNLADRAGAGHVNPHKLRHAYGTHMVRQGVPLTTVKVCMRHSSITTTAGYIEVTDDDLGAAAASLPWAA